MVASPWLKIFCLAPPKSAAPAVLLIHDDSCHLFKHCLKRLPPPYPSRLVLAGDLPSRFARARRASERNQNFCVRLHIHVAFGLPPPNLYEALRLSVLPTGWPTTDTA